MTTGNGSELKPGEGYRLTHNTLFEAIRIIVVMTAMIVISFVTIPWRVLRGKKP